jgi:DNA anti-recombination protein RmuC
MNIVQQFKYNNSNDYELIKRIRKQVIKVIKIRIQSLIKSTFNNLRS